MMTNNKKYALLQINNVSIKISKTLICSAIYAININLKSQLRTVMNLLNVLYVAMYVAMCVNVHMFSPVQLMTF